VFKPGAIASLVVLVYAVCLVIGNIVGAVLAMAVMAAINRRRERTEQALRYFATPVVAGPLVAAPDNDLGNDWPWRNCS
jgi:energy-converting hydrogenase Eha subunit A